MRYRRADVAGGTYFFTVNLLDRTQRILVEHGDILREAMRTVKTASHCRVRCLPGEVDPAVLGDHYARPIGGGKRNEPQHFETTGDDDVGVPVGHYNLRDAHGPPCAAQNSAGVRMG